MLTGSILPRSLGWVGNGGGHIAARQQVVGGLFIAVVTIAAVIVAGCTSAGAIGEGGSSAGTAASEPAATAAAASDRPTAAATPAPTPTPPTFSQQVVQLAPGTTDEASGIAASSGTPGGYFLVDDGTGTGTIVAVGSAGGVLARIAVDGMSAGNAEALASGTCGATPLPDRSGSQRCLYVGDIGDNKADRADIAVYRFAEPELGTPPTDPVPADDWRYTYPDGPQNAEAMLVGADGALIIVTKPDAKGGQPHRMYRAEPGGGELSLVREFRPPDAAQPFRTLFTGNVVTDLASSPGRVLLLTYDEVQEFSAPDPAADLTTFPDWPHRRLAAPSLPQAEGITVAADGCGYALASEAGPGGKNGSLRLLTCP